MNIPTAELTPSQLDQLDNAREILIKHVGEFICRHHGLEDLKSHSNKRRFRNRWEGVGSSIRYWGELAVQFRHAQIRRSVIAWASQWDLDDDERDVLSQLAGLSVFSGFEDPQNSIAEAQENGIACTCVDPFQCAASCPVFTSGANPSGPFRSGRTDPGQARKSYTKEQIEHLATDIVKRKMKDTLRRKPNHLELSRVLNTIRAGRVPEDILRKAIVVEQVLADTEAGRPVSWNLGG